MPYIYLSDDAYEMIEEYADVFGISIESAASKAIVRWMEYKGEIVMVAKTAKTAKSKTRSKAAPVLVLPVAVRTGKQGVKQEAMVD